MSEKQKTNQEGNINQQIDTIKKQISEANTQIKKYVEKRNQLHEQVRKFRAEINQMKKERDSLNAQVKLLKEQRNLIRVKVKPIMDEVEGINEQINDLKKTVPHVSQHELQGEVDAIEWKISTTSLDIQEEKRLVGEVRNLENQLIGYKKIDRKHQKIKELIAQRKSFDSQADVFHKELTDLAKKSQELHNVIMEKVNSVKKDRAEADSLHQSFVKAKEQNRLWYEQIKQLIDQDRGLRARFKEFDLAKRKEEEAKKKKEQAEKAVKEKEIKEKIGSEARNKLQRGEKINWDEFQIMLGDDDEEDN